MHLRPTRALAFRTPPATEASDRDRGARHASRFEFSKDAADFDSDGVDCAGWIYRPDRPRTAPLVVMGPGLAAERTFGYPAYAERLAARGYAVFLFDYRRFGDSAGRPRQLVSVADQREDWAAAIDRATRVSGVDTDRVALWGASLGGGLALEVAASDYRVDAVVAQSPVVDGRALLRQHGTGALARGVAAGLADRVTGLVGRRRRIPLVPGYDDERAGVAGPVGGGSLAGEGSPDDGGSDGDPGADADAPAFALLPDPTAAATLADLVPLRSDWENRVPARVVLDLLGYRPIEDLAAGAVPTLLLTGMHDRVVPVGTVAAAADAVDESTFVTLPTGHFQLFEDPWIERAIDHQVAFLDHVL